jgi:hypothetical protein
MPTFVSAEYVTQFNTGLLRILFNNLDVNIRHPDKQRPVPPQTLNLTRSFVSNLLNLHQCTRKITRLGGKERISHRRGFS